MRGAPGRIAALLKPCRHRADARFPVSVLARQPQGREASCPGRLAAVSGATEDGAGQHKLLRSVGIVREVYSKWERRVPLCPSHVRELVGDGISVVVQPSKSRVFSDKEFADAGASVCNDLSECSVILGVKQVPAQDLLPDKTYMFFSHTIKGQEENMPLLDACLKQRVRLVDYECITQGLSVTSLFIYPRTSTFPCPAFSLGPDSDRLWRCRRQAKRQTAHRVRVVGGQGRHDQCSSWARRAVPCAGLLHPLSKHRIGIHVRHL